MDDVSSGSETSRGTDGAITAERIVVCQTAPELMWKALSDTDRLNKALGLPPIQLKPIQSSQGARFRISTTFEGTPVQFDELPTTWIQGQDFTIRRLMTEGPLSTFEMRFRFRPRQPEGSLVSVRIAAQPRMQEGPFGATKGVITQSVIKHELARAAQGIALHVRQIDAHPQHKLEPQTPSAPLLDARALQSAGRRLRAKVDPLLAQHLMAFLEQEDPHELFSLRPYALADAWGLPRRQVLEACLHAVEAGLLELQWSLMCPSCRTAAGTVPTLAELMAHADCQFCELRIDTRLEESLEATFRLNRAISRGDLPMYCMAGPARVPHVVTQALLEPQRVLDVRAPLELGRYRIFARGGEQVWLEVTPAPVPALSDSAPLDLAQLSSRQTVQVAPGDPIPLFNSYPDVRHVRIEQSAWRRQAATVRDLSLLPTFRRTFSHELLRPGLTLSVARMTVLFSDLSNSTRLYQELGDASAFRFVYDHFALLEAVIEAHGGVMVKTSGDAVMAAFDHEEDALKAALEMLRHFEQYRRSHPECAIAHLKLGLNSGACYLVSERVRLDYFGQIVNVAARLQGQAHDDELVISSALADSALTQGILVPGQVGERYQARLKGVEPALEVVRVKVLSEGE